MEKPVRTQIPSTLARRTIVALWIWLAADAVQALACLFEIMTSSAMSEEELRLFIATSADAPLTGTESIGLVYMLASIVCGILVFGWNYVADRNAHSFSAAMTMSPGWNVGWFFVRIGNLWKPFQRLREAWTATVDPDRRDAVDVPGWIGTWWGSWIATTLLGNLAFRMSLKADTGAELIAVD